MSKLVLISPEGVVVSDKQSPEVTKHQEDETFDQMAARSAEQQSTPIKEVK